MNPALSATVSAASLVLVIALTAGGEGWLVPPFPNEPTRLRESRLRIDALLSDVAELQLREALAKPRRSGQPQAAGEGPGRDAALLDALEERIRRRESRALLQPELLVEDDLRRVRWGVPPDDLADLVYTLDCLREAILDARRPLEERITAYAALRHLPSSVFSSEMQATWLRDIRLADTGQRQSMVYAINGVSGNAGIMAELLHLARFDDNSSVRVGAIRGLEQYLEHEQVRATLELLHRTANSLSVRTQAGRTLYGRRRDDD